MTKFAASGAILKIGDGGGPEVFTTVAQVRSIAGPGLSLELFDTTTHDSVAGYRDFVASFVDPGELTLEILFDPDSVTQSAMRTALTGRTNPRNFKLIFPDLTATEWLLPCIVTGFSPNAPVDGELTASVTMKVSAAPTLA